MNHKRRKRKKLRKHSVWGIKKFHRSAANRGGGARCAPPPGSASKQIKLVHRSKKKGELGGLYCHSSCHVSFLSGKFPQFQLPCWPIWTDLADWCISSDLLNFCCTILRLSWLSALFHRGCCPCPGTSRPLLVAPSMTWCCRLLSACSTALVTDHFLPVLTSIPALLTFLSSESRY